MILGPSFGMKAQMRAIRTQKRKAIMEMIGMIKIWGKNTLKQRRKLALKF